MSTWGIVNRKKVIVNRKKVIVGAGNPHGYWLSGRLKGFKSYSPRYRVQVVML